MNDGFHVRQGGCTRSCTLGLFIQWVPSSQHLLSCVIVHVLAGCLTCGAPGQSKKASKRTSVVVCQQDQAAHSSVLRVVAAQIILRHFEAEAAKEELGFSAYCQSLVLLLVGT